LAAAIEGQIGVKPRLVRGDNGVFEVSADGALVFSKKQAGRFPTDAEVLAALRARS
jgi:selT/selW/selH-like putative selenoprotein